MVTASGGSIHNISPNPRSAWDLTIKFSPAKSILKLQVGDEIKLTETDFFLLFRAFFAEIETKFV